MTIQPEGESSSAAASRPSETVTATSLFAQSSKEQLASLKDKYQPDPAQRGCNVSSGYTIRFELPATFVHSKDQTYTYNGSEYLQLTARPVTNILGPLTVSEPYTKLPEQPSVEDILRMFQDCTYLADYPIISIDGHLPSLTITQEDRVVPIVQGANFPRHMKFSLECGRAFEGQRPFVRFASGAVESAGDGEV
jgi:hypothetical protein